MLDYLGFSMANFLLENMLCLVSIRLCPFSISRLPYILVIMPIDISKP